MSQTSFVFSNGKSILNPEDRIREYCEIEIYQGYDDKHSITNKITRSDVDAANKLYAQTWILKIYLNLNGKFSKIKLNKFSTNLSQ